MSHVEPARDPFHSCDMSRTTLRPLAVARWLYGRLPRAQMATRRRANFQHLRQALSGAKGSRVLFDALPADVPYALPLYVQDADSVYRALRAVGMPVFRWDTLWPGTPALADDAGAVWSRNVLQLLCHQDLSEAETALIAATVRRLL